MSEQWLVTADWRRQGYFCSGAPGDGINRLPVDLSGIDIITAYGTYTKETFTPGPPLGNTRLLVTLDGYEGAYDALYVGFDGTGVDDIPVTGGQTYTASAWINNVWGSDDLIFRVMRPNRMVVASKTFTLPAPGAWGRVDLTFTVPSGVEYIDLSFRRANQNGSQVRFYLYGLSLVAGAQAPRGYNDGTLAHAAADFAPRIRDGGLTFNLGCRAYEPMADESVLTFTVDNHDRLYSPENSASPIAPWIGPLAPVAVYAYTDADGYRMLWRGITEILEVEPFRFGSRRASFTCTGVKRLLDESSINLPLFENQRADQIIATVLPLVVAPPIVPAQTALEAGLKVFPTFGDNLIAEPNTPVNAYLVIQDAVNGERGRFFFDREGKAVFWNRHHLLNGDAPALTIDNTAEDMRYHVGDDYANRVEVTCYPRPVPTNASLWELRAPLEIPPGQSRTVTVPFLNADGSRRIGATSATQPSGSDFVTDRTGVTITAFEVGAQQAVLTIHNANSQTATIYTLRVKGLGMLERSPVTVAASKTPPASWPAVEPYILDLPAIDDPTEAYSIAEFEVLRRSVLQGRVASVTLLAQADGEADASLLDATIGTPVRVVEYQTAHDRTYYIVGERHTIDPVKNTHIATWELEPAVTTSYWVLGISTLGVNTIPAY